MKTLTIFRNGNYEISSGNLLRESAYQIFSDIKAVYTEFGTGQLILTSHILRAKQSAQVIRLASRNPPQILERASLSSYYAGNIRSFQKDFLGQMRYNGTQYEHIVLVSHKMNIGEMTGVYLPFGKYVILQAEKWEDIFDKTKHRVRSLADFPDHQEALLSFDEKKELEKLVF